MVENFGKIPRAEINWNPTIDKEKCTDCGTCAEFCHRGVFGDNGEVSVESPTNCVVGCTGCRDQCPEGAISFPSLIELRDALRALREKYR